MSSCCSHNITVLTLKRMVPLSHHQLNMTEVVTVDSAQRRRLLQSSLYGAFSFPVEGFTFYDPRVSYFVCRQAMLQRIMMFPASRMPIQS
ncbi:unnamed protein product [Cochlearia groenlandica]